MGASTIAAEVLPRLLQAGEELGRGVVAVVAVVTVLGWLALYRAMRRGAARVRAFEDLPLAPSSSLPRVSLIVPAMNEAAALARAVETFRALDYPDLEIVLVDDRSTDDTAAVVDAAARADPRVKAVHVTALPEGWLGKVHAQARGVEHASGAWLLFTDADVFLDKSALRRGIAHALANDLDQVVVVAKGNPPAFLVDVVECAVAGLIHAAAFFARRRNAPDGGGVVGSGQYSLVKRAALDKSAGIAWYKMEPADDFALSLCLRNAGARAAHFVSRGHVSFEWYPSFRAMVRGFEKNLFPVATGYRARPAILIALALLVFNAGPLLAPLAFGPVWGGVAVALACATLVATTVVRARLSRRSALALLLNPLGQLILAAVLVRAMIVVLGRGGLTWRDTFYPLAALREGQRVRSDRRRA